MGHVRGKDQYAFYQGKDQREDDHNGHFGEKIAEPAVDEQEGGKGNDGREDRRGHGRQDLQGTLYGGL